MRRREVLIATLIASSVVGFLFISNSVFASQPNPDYRNYSPKPVYGVTLAGSSTVVNISQNFNLEDISPEVPIIARGVGGELIEETLERVQKMPDVCERDLAVSSGLNNIVSSRVQNISGTNRLDSMKQKTVEFATWFKNTCKKRLGIFGVQRSMMPEEDYSDNIKLRASWDKFLSQGDVDKIFIKLPDCSNPKNDIDQNERLHIQKDAQRRLIEVIKQFALYQPTFCP